MGEEKTRHRPIYWLVPHWCLSLLSASADGRQHFFPSSFLPSFLKRRRTKGNSSRTRSPCAANRSRVDQFNIRCEKGNSRSDASTAAGAPNQQSLSRVVVVVDDVVTLQGLVDSIICVLPPPPRSLYCCCCCCHSTRCKMIAFCMPVSWATSRPQASLGHLLLIISFTTNHWATGDGGSSSGGNDEGSALTALLMNVRVSTLSFLCRRLSEIDWGKPTTLKLRDREPKG